jgi:CheY-like chemotaxis protein
MAIILVVEDNPDNSALAEKILKHLGHSPIICDTGESARAWILENRPDLILMDISLPDANGFELLGDLRAEGRMNGIPCIVLTAHSLASYRERAENEGVDAFLVKPFTPRDLIALVSRFIPNGATK